MPFTIRFRIHAKKSKEHFVALIRVCLAWLIILINLPMYLDTFCLIHCIHVQFIDHLSIFDTSKYRCSPRGVMVKVRDCGLYVNGFELQLCYYVQFRINTSKKGMNLLILPTMGLIVSLLFFFEDNIGIK